MKVQRMIDTNVKVEGQVGLSPRPTYLNNFKSLQSSFLTLLKESQHISSLSYGYTAGASYRKYEPKPTNFEP